VVEVEIRGREKPSEVFGEPPKGPDGWRVGEVKTTPAWSQQPESSRTRVNPNITKVEKEYVSRRKILIWLEEVEEGMQVTFRLCILVKPMRQEEAKEECEHMREMLGFGDLKFWWNKDLMYIPERHQLYFLEMIRPYVEIQGLDKAIEFLEETSVPLFKKFDSALAKFEEYYAILLEGIKN